MVRACHFKRIVLKQIIRRLGRAVHPDRSRRVSAEAKQESEVPDMTAPHLANYLFPQLSFWQQIREPGREADERAPEFSWVVFEDLP